MKAANRVLLSPPAAHERRERAQPCSAVKPQRAAVRKREGASSRGRPAIPLPGQRVSDQAVAQSSKSAPRQALAAAGSAARAVDREGGRAELLSAVPTRLEVGRPACCPLCAMPRSARHACRIVKYVSQRTEIVGRKIVAYSANVPQRFLYRRVPTRRQRHTNGTAYPLGTYASVHRGKLTSSVASSAHRQSPPPH